MTRFALIVFPVLLAVSVAACAPRAAGPSADTVGPPPKVTVPPDLSTPERSVQTYLEYVTLAYRMLNSEATSETATDAENVRIDAYIELSRQENRGIEQKLRGLEARTVSADGTATVATEEDWTYRYFSPQTLRYSSPAYEITYDATYTVVRQPDDTWLVDSVEATPRGELK